MGYTHYYELPSKEITEDIWDKFTSDVKKLLIKPYVALGGGSGAKGSSPNITKTHISLNGIGDNAHEALYINRRNFEWEFTKTAHKRYDRVVVAVLILAHYQLGMEVSSDGNRSDWKSGLRYLNRVLDTNYDIPSTI